MSLLDHRSENISAHTTEQPQDLLPDNQPNKPSGLSRRSRRLRTIAITAGTTVLVGTGGAVVIGESLQNSHSSAMSKPTPDNLDSQPVASQTESQTPSSVPGGVKQTSESNPTNGNTVSPLESLKNMQPLVALVDRSHPDGTPEVIKTLYKDMQLADQTGRLDFLEAAIGSRNMTSDLGVQYTRDIAQFQQYFSYHPPQQLTYTYDADNISQSAPGTKTWNLVATQNTGGAVVRAAQRITLGQELDSTGAEHWIISSVDSATILQ